MSDELKPCPFCGSEAEVHELLNFREYIVCTNPACGMRTPTRSTDVHSAMVELWNRRAERTCHSTIFDDYTIYSCSACGFVSEDFGLYDYCPRCGAKVVCE